MDAPVIIGALVTAVTTLSGLIYRELLRRAEAAEKDRDFYRRKWLAGIGLAEIATDEAAKRVEDV